VEWVIAPDDLDGAGYPAAARRWAEALDCDDAVDQELTDKATGGSSGRGTGSPLTCDFAATAVELSKSDARTGLLSSRSAVDSG
jgi:hypothetical protein